MVPVTLLNLGIAFAAGILTFFTGCLAPMAPIYISYLAGSLPQDLTNHQKRVFTKNALFFVAGFLLVFLSLGLTVNTFFRLLSVYRPLLQKFSGLVLIVFGLQMSQIINLPWLNKNPGSSFPKDAIHSQGAVLLGITFGLAWTPCIGPVLAAILFWVASQATFTQGALLLILFSLGLALPFVALGLLFDKISPIIRKINHYSYLLNRAAGGVVIVYGLLVLSGNFGLLSGYFLNRFGSAARLIQFRQ